MIIQITTSPKQSFDVCNCSSNVERQRLSFSVTRKVDKEKLNLPIVLARWNCARCSKAILWLHSLHLYLFRFSFLQIVNVYLC